MKKILGLSILSVALVAGGMYASQKRVGNGVPLKAAAATTLTMTAVDPADGSTVTSLQMIKINFAEEVDLTQAAQDLTLDVLITKEGATESQKMNYFLDADDYYAVDLYSMAEIVEEGTYTIVVPEGLVTVWDSDGSQTNPEFTLTYTVGAGGGSTGGDVSGATFAFIESDPAEGEVSMLSSIKTRWNADMDNPDNVNGVVLKDASGNIVTTASPIGNGSYTDPWDPSKFYYDCFVIGLKDKVTTPGQYTLVIPQGLLNSFENTSQVNEAKELHFTVVGATGPNANVIFTPNPASGTTLSAEDFNTNGISLSFSDMGMLCSVSTLPMSDEAGNTFDLPLATGVLSYGMAKINPNVEFTKSGKYTITVPEGTFYNQEYKDSEGASGRCNPETQLEYNITVAGGDDEPTEEVALTLLQITNDGVVTNLLAENASIAVWKLDAPLEAQFNTESVGYIQMDIYRTFVNDEGMNEKDYLKSMICISKNDEGKFVYELPGYADLTFLNGETYTFDIQMYDAVHDAPYERVNLGNLKVIVTGAGEGYKYSELTLVSVSPEPGTEISDPKQEFVFTFSGPVNIDQATTGVNLGFGDMMAFETLTASDDRSVYTATVRESYLASLRPELLITIGATDDEGLRLLGDGGFEDTSCFMYQWQCYLGSPKVYIIPEYKPEINEQGIPVGEVDLDHLTELYEFYAYQDSPIGITLSWTSTPYLVDAEGNEVTRVNTNEGWENVFAPGQEDNMDAKSVGFRFRLNEKVTAVGNYTLICPTASWSLGTEFDGAPNAYTEYPFTINDPSGLNGIKGEYGKVKAYSRNGNIVIAGVPAGVNVAVYNVLGSKVAGFVADGRTYTIPAQGNVYVISLTSGKDTKAFKLIHK